MTQHYVVSSGEVRRDATLMSGDTMKVLLGGEAISTTVSAGGVQTVYGRALSTILASGSGFMSGEQIVESGGIANHVTLQYVDVQIVESGGATYNVTATSDSNQEIYGLASNVSAGDGDNIHVYSGGKLFDLNIDSAVAVSYSGAVLSEAIVSARGQVTVAPGGYARGIIVDGVGSDGGFSGGLLAESQGAQVSGVTVESGGGVLFYDHATAKALTVESGGFLDYDINSAVTLTDLTISSGGYIDATAGTIRDAHLLPGATASTHDAKAVDIFVSRSISAGPAEDMVGSGAKDIGASVAGFQEVSAHGVTKGATIQSGGFEFESAGGTVRDLTVSSAGTAVISTRIIGCDLSEGAKLEVHGYTRVDGLAVQGGAVLDIVDRHYISAFVSSGDLYAYTASGQPAVELYALSGDTASLRCTVKTDGRSGTDITFVIKGGDAITHAAAAFATTPAGATQPAYSLQSAHADFAARSRINHTQAWAQHGAPL